MSQLMTNWLCIATAGDTVDGRIIEESWILESAELYDRHLYTACIWPEHERWFGSMGEVLALKAERDEEGTLKLYAQLRPNQHLLQANRDGQLLFTSAEFTPTGNFRGTGKTYLEGLGVTCSPASVGTDRLQFNKNGKKFRYGALKPLVFDEVKQFKEEKMAKGKGWRSIFNIEEPSVDNIPEETGASDAMQALAEALSALEVRVTAIETQLISTAEKVDDVEDDVEVIKDAVDTPEFKQLKDNLSSILGKFSKLDTVASRIPGKNPRGGKEKRFTNLV
ncbi:TPA: GPO family capsid scaffolding protein [Proteus mirabilis]|nr:phage capsid protein [Proteus mirabilis]HBC5641706.1 GPO family capsid scaffolding protein [Proteus mirabilis]HBC5644302.1 GPO family capsid scaffolding protein [Proteus mirabilis]HCK1901783.1 GPO family capsid scaffolding protein [Proteus mirabilis]HEI8679486.1 GPO family capsid scaffolding protein [Proteus mirabilis]